MLYVCIPCYSGGKGKKIEGLRPAKHEILPEKQTEEQKDWGMVQVVEPLLSKWKTLNLITNPILLPSPQNVGSVQIRLREHHKTNAVPLLQLLGLYCKHQNLRFPQTCPEPKLSETMREGISPKYRLLRPTKGS
jgi:hypothetical protein